MGPEAEKTASPMTFGIKLLDNLGNQVKVLIIVIDVFTALSIALEELEPVQGAQRCAFLKDQKILCQRNVIVTVGRKKSPRRDST